ncbi:MAG: AAA family ATPase, partial [Proteobacteria bacterium]|nr:AAA family ATPase [Pseudomonadota bacterium]
YIQGVVDRNNRAGQYILSGSQHFLLSEAVSQSLAGRAAVLQLLPFSLSEVCGRLGLNSDEIGHKKPPLTITDAPEQLFDAMFNGFYPRPRLQHIPITDWMSSYYKTYLERDVRSLANIGDLDSFSRFVKLLAGRCGQLLDLTSLGNDAGVSHTTSSRWISILEASELEVQKGTVRPQMCHARHEQPSRGERTQHDLAANRGEDPDFYFWRDSQGLEIDLVWERAGIIHGLEIKSGATFSPDFIQGLTKWSDILDGQKLLTGLVYGGDQGFNYKEVPVYSWRCL